MGAKTFSVKASLDRTARAKGRVKSHSNRFKRIRAEINRTISPSGMTVRDTIYDIIMVRSRKYNVTTKDGIKHKDRAIQVRMQNGTPRAIYKRAKAILNES